MFGKWESFKCIRSSEMGSRSMGSTTTNNKMRNGKTMKTEQLQKIINKKCANGKLHTQVIVKTERRKTKVEIKNRRKKFIPFIIRKKHRTMTTTTLTHLHNDYCHWNDGPIRLEPKNNNNNNHCIAYISISTCELRSILYFPVQFSSFLFFSFSNRSFLFEHLFCNRLSVLSVNYRKREKKIVTFSVNVYYTTKYRTRHRA